MRPPSSAVDSRFGLPPLLCRSRTLSGRLDGQEGLCIPHTLSDTCIRRIALQMRKSPDPVDRPMKRTVEMNDLAIIESAVPYPCGCQKDLD